MALWASSPWGTYFTALNLGPEQELIWALGGEEVLATVTADGQVIFDHPNHLDLLKAEDMLTLALYQNNDADNLLWEFALVKAGLAVDSNRDGVIDTEREDDTAFVVPANTNDTVEQSETFRFVRTAQAQTEEPEISIAPDSNSEDHPFRFWFNDDDDEGEINDGKKAKNDIPGNGTADGIDNRVDGLRDLVDFFPVYVDVKSALENYPPDEYHYELRHAQGLLNYLETELKPKSNNDAEQAGAYLRTAEAGRSLADEDVTRITPSGVVLSDTFLKDIARKDRGILLLEAIPSAAAIDTPLELRVIRKSNGDELGKTRLYLSIDNVERMFRHVNLMDIQGVDGPGVANHPARKDLPENLPDSEMEGRFLVFLHGCCGTKESAQGWHAEMFKRFYQLGMNARFIGVTWDGAAGNDYHTDVLQAFRTSQHLKSRLESIEGFGGPFAVVAHSLGNVVVSNAIAEFDFVPERYLMLNAAMPIEALDSGQPNDERGEDMARRMTEANWYEYWEYRDKLYASYWNELFSGEDGRSKLRWRDRFAGVLPYAYNFYSPGEDVLEHPAESEEFGDILLDAIKNFNFARHSWVGQEIGKGCQFLPAAALFAECQGGWQFNDDQRDLEFIGAEEFENPQTGETTYRKLTASEVSGRIDRGELTDEHWAQYGFFRRLKNGQRDLYGSIQEGNQLNGNPLTQAQSSERANEPDIQWRMLARALPAQSSPVGSSNVPKITQEAGEKRNFDVMTIQEDFSWPAERGNDRR